MPRLTVLAIGIALIVAPASAQQPGLSPAQVGEIFCISRLGSDMAPVEGLLTAGLTDAIAHAELENDAIQKAHPDEKPPLGDGIPWQTFPDYADKCTVGPVDLSADSAMVSIDYGFSKFPEADFADRLHLDRVAGPSTGTDIWRIDDIVYSDGNNLRSALILAFAS